MSKEFLRTFKTFDIEEVKKHLLIMGDLKGDCASCREIGIDPTAKECPGCRTSFQYVASRRSEANPGERFQFARRMSERRPDLTILDYSDYTKTIGQKQARDFFA